MSAEKSPHETIDPPLYRSLRNVITPVIREHFSQHPQEIQRLLIDSLVAKLALKDNFEGDLHMNAYDLAQSVRLTLIAVLEKCSQEKIDQALAMLTDEIRKSIACLKKAARRPLVRI